jgi:hypothetical protein
MRNKLAVDGLAIGSNREKFAYIYSRLQGQAKQMSVAFAERGGGEKDTYDPKEFMTYLDTAFTDPNAARRALSRLASMRQGPNEVFHKFLPRFTHNLFDAHGSEWSEKTKINYLREAINLDLSAAIVASQEPDTFPEYCQLLSAVCSKLEGLRYKGTKRGTKSHTDSAHANRSQRAAAFEDAGAMDWEPVSTKVSRLLATDNPGLQGKRAKWVTKEETLQRRAEGRCYRCGRSGCHVGTCPLKPAVNPKNDQETRVNKAASGIKSVVTQAAVDSAEDVLRAARDEALSDDSEN